MAFFGSTRILNSASSSKLSRVVTSGSLPTSSGIIPCFIKSSGVTFLKTSPSSPLLTLLVSAPKPKLFCCVLFDITFSSPSKAPPTMKRIFFVSISISS